MGRVAVIDFSKVSSSPLNPLGLALRNYILKELERAVEDVNVTSIVVTGGMKNFSAGADLTELAKLVSGPASTSSLVLSKGIGGSGSPTLLDVVASIEASPKPVVAAITGACLGGGLEVALACHYRICFSGGSKLGLPEVNVGVIPGAGGTQRLPRLIGLESALEIILTGKPVSSKQALKLGMVNAVVDNKKELIESAQKWAEWAEVMPLDDCRLSAKRVAITPPQAHVMLHVASLQLPSEEAGGEGVHSALEAIRAACSMPFTQGMQVESRLFLKVLSSAQGKARRHAFFAVRKAQKPILPPSQLSSTITSHPLMQKNSIGVEVAVVGAGTMGGGIALCLLQAGFKVWLVDVSEKALDKGLAFMKRTIETNAKRGKVSSKQAKTMLQNLLSTSNLECLSKCYLVVEAVVENLKIKQNIFRTLSQVCPKSAILVSNTSTLDIDQMGSAVVTDPGRVAGWHFFSPAHIMQLVEIVVGAETSNETIAILQALNKRIKKIGVVVGNCDGFCGNRMLKPYSAETVLLLTEDGCSVERVDKVFLNFGMALGPFQMSDLAGNDIGYNIRKERGWVRLNDNDPIPPKRPTRYTELADVMVSQLGRNGQKSGKGWYDYNPAVGKGRKGLPSKEMQQLVQSYATAGASQPISDDEIIERVLFPLVNEGFKILEEGIARSPSDIDVVYLYGYGFPAWRGGPMYWADNAVGLPVLLEKLEQFAHKYPDTDHYVPSMLLRDCVELGMTVEQYFQKGLLRKKHDPRSKL